MDTIISAFVFAPVFLLIWLVKYPTELWEALTFKDRDAMAVFMGLGCWAFVIMSSLFVGWLAVQIK